MSLFLEEIHEDYLVCLLACFEEMPPRYFEI